MVSDPGDYIGAGLTYDLSTSNATFSASTNFTGEIGLFVKTPDYGEFWSLNSAAADQAPLTPGYYADAMRSGFRDAGHPGLDVFGDGRGSNTLTGSFTVAQADLTPDGQAVRGFAASFEQHSEDAAPALRGTIQYITLIDTSAGVLADDFDVDGEFLRVIFVSGPAHGALDLHPDGTLTYTPSSDYSGSDRFTYRVSDGRLMSNIATARITVNGNTLEVGDSSFEAVALGGGQFCYGPAGSAWTFAGNAGISGNGSAFTGGGPAAPDGGQVAVLQTTGSMTQALSFAQAGSFVVSFLAAQRANQGTSAEDFQVLIDGTVVGTFRPSGTSYQAYATAPMALAAGQHTLQFVGLDTAGGDNTAFIDAVRLARA